MEDLGSHPQCFFEAAGAGRHDHELLDINIVVGMGAAVDDVHHRQGQLTGIGAADIFVERHACLFGSSLGNSQGDPQDGVGTQVALEFGAVNLQHPLVDPHLITGFHADQFISDLVVDIIHRLQHPFAQVAAFVAVPQFQCLTLAG